MKAVLWLWVCCQLSINPAWLGAQEPAPVEASIGKAIGKTPGTNADYAQGGVTVSDQSSGETGGYAGHFSCRVFSGLDRELCAAVSDGESQQASRLIEAGANLEAKSVEKSTEGMTPLIVAVRFGWGFEAVELLLDAGADVNAKDARGASVLIRAVENRRSVDFRLLRLLLDHGADVNAKGPKEMTALMHGVMIDDPGCAAMIISAGGKVNAKDAAGWTALMHANRRKSGFPEVVKLLLKYRADVNTAHKYGGTALMIASYNCHPRAVKILLDSGADIQPKDKSGWTALICAAKGGCVATVAQLVEAGSDVNAKDRFGKTALRHASESRHTEIARLLTKAGAEP